MVFLYKKKFLFTGEIIWRGRRSSDSDGLPERGMVLVAKQTESIGKACGRTISNGSAATVRSITTQIKTCAIISSPALPG